MERKSGRLESIGDDMKYVKVSLEQDGKIYSSSVPIADKIYLDLSRLGAIEEIEKNELNQLKQKIEIEKYEKSLVASLTRKKLER